MYKSHVRIQELCIVRYFLSQIKHISGFIVQNFQKIDKIPDFVYLVSQVNIISGVTDKN